MSEGNPCLPDILTMFAGDESRVYPPAAGDDQSLPAQLEPARQTKPPWKL